MPWISLVALLGKIKRMAEMGYMRFIRMALLSTAVKPLYSHNFSDMPCSIQLLLGAE